ncbi:hypothetical protein DUI87_00496 [Hirundo rustica rustica]|uniref:Uncharacterized protein n=1 Tax=Hirundo rustica rustica TaxID=333673 RepID=A0A3M0LBQ7_HIRRU|nr:hypothetical protein DUI87_00496 [Hirundo rustica rustica]
MEFRLGGDARPCSERKVGLENFGREFQEFPDRLRHSQCCRWAFPAGMAPLELGMRELGLRRSGNEVWRWHLDVGDPGDYPEIFMESPNPNRAVVDPGAYPKIFMGSPNPNRAVVDPGAYPKIFMESPNLKWAVADPGAYPEIFMESPIPN